MAAAPRRTHGMEWPLSTPQVLAGGIELAVTAATFVLFGIYARSDAVAIPVVLYAVCFAGVLFGWAYCEFLDPSLPVRERRPHVRAARAGSQSAGLPSSAATLLTHEYAPFPAACRAASPSRAWRRRRRASGIASCAARP